MSELDLIAWIKEHAPTHSAVTIGIGDDAALLNVPEGALVTTDMLMDGVDFTLSQTDPVLVGRKALAVNLSDIAAMAGIPKAAFVSLALPRTGGMALAKQIYEGIFTLAREYNVAIAGGDTNSWDGPLVINITAVGTPAQKRVVVRAKAEARDWIMVTGELGGSLKGHHLTFTPRVREAQVLVARYDIHAMIDLSDGLAKDLRHILEASGVGATLQETALPISAAARAMMEDLKNGKAPWEHALSDGEDFELCFTVAPEVGERILEDHLLAPLRVSKIGRITPTSEFVIERLDGTRQPVVATGYHHTLD